MSGIMLTEHEPFVYKVYSFIVRYLGISYPFVCARELNRHGFNVFVQTVAFCLATLLASTASLTAHRYRIQLGKLLNRLEERPFLPNEERGGDRENKLINEWKLSKNRQGIILYVTTLVVVVCESLYSISKRIRSSDSTEWLSAFAFGPITVLDVTRSPNYEISWLYQIACLFFLAAILCTVIIILSGILAYICTQLKMLQNNLRMMTKYYHGESVKVINTIPSSVRTSPSKIPWEYLKIAIGEAVSYHLNILEIINEVDEIFSIFMFSLYFIVVCFLCFVMYAGSLLPINDPNVIMFCWQAVVTAGMPLIVCYWGEQVTFESEEVGRATYEANFVGSDLRFQKALNLIVVRSQKSVRIKAGKFVDTSMATFAWILRSSVSYFMVARNLNVGEK